MSTKPTSLERWTAAFDKLDYCPWIGPRPLTEEDAQHLLVGREKDKRDFLSAVNENKIVILTGPSAVGKSSLLDNGLVPVLKRGGFRPLICREWIASDPATTPEKLVVAGIAQMPEQARDIDLSLETGSLCEQLDRRYGRRAVLILDQFEELIRYGSPRNKRSAVRYSEFVEWLSEVNRRHATHIVLSLRKEYEHELEPIEKSVKAFSLGRLSLTSVTSEAAVRQIIEKPALRNGTPPKGLVEPKAKELLLGAWRRYVRQPRGEELGLLDVRATLYVLHDRAARGVVERQHVAALARMGNGNPFAVGLRESAAIKLRRCIEAASYQGCRRTGCNSDPCTEHRRLLPQPLDPYLIEGTRAVIQRILPHLSSADYKVPQVDKELVRRVALERELRVLEIDPEKAVAAYGAIARLRPEPSRNGNAAKRPQPTRPRSAAMDLLTAPSFILEEVIGQIPAEKDRLAAMRLGLREVSADDPEGLSSGPMLGKRPSLVLVEEARRVALAIEWLRAAKLVRVTTPESDVRVLGLIHDGFGEALTAWAEAQGRRPAHAIQQLTAARGETYEWQTDQSATPQWPELSGGRRHKVIANVRWRECHISASFRRVVFLNCDFRGSRFDKCGFAGVAFVNCVLDGVTFSNCTFHGKTAKPPAREAYSEKPPRFIVAVSDTDASSLAHYRHVRGPMGSWLFSGTSGIPADPWTRADETREGVQLPLSSPSIMMIGEKHLPLRLPRGGMMMIGGRLCSLMFYRCDAEAGGSVALLHVSGAGLDVVEHEEGRFEIFGGKIRGLSVSRDKDPIGEDTTRDEKDAPFSPSRERRRSLALTVTSCYITNVNLGDQLRGDATFRNCKLHMLLNLNGPQFPVRIENCLFHSLVNAEPVDPGVSQEDEALKMRGIRNREALAREMEPMNYRLRPEGYAPRRGSGRSASRPTREKAGG